MLKQFPCQISPSAAAFFKKNHQQFVTVSIAQKIQKRIEGYFFRLVPFYMKTTTYSRSDALGI